MLKKMPLVPGGDTSTSLRSMHGSSNALENVHWHICFRPVGSSLFYVNTWAMIWSLDWPKPVDKWTLKTLFVSL